MNPAAFRSAGSYLTFRGLQFKERQGIPRRQQPASPNHASFAEVQPDGIPADRRAAGNEPVPMERHFAAQQLRQPEYGLFSISVELYDEKNFSIGNIGCGEKRIQRTVKPVVFSVTGSCCLRLL